MKAEFRKWLDRRYYWGISSHSTWYPFGGMNKKEVEEIINKYQDCAQEISSKYEGSNTENCPLVEEIS